MVNHEYKVGDKVKLVSKPPYHWSISMNKYLGREVIITKFYQWCDRTAIQFKNDGSWVFYLDTSIEKYPKVVKEW